MKRVLLTSTLWLAVTMPSAAYSADVVSVPTISTSAKTTLHLSLIRDFFENNDTAGGFFSSGSDLNDVLLQDINLFLEKYHDMPIAAKALFLKGRMQLEQGDEAAAAISWLQVLYEFPDSDTVIVAKQQLLELLENDWSDHADVIKGIINQSQKGETGARLAHLIRQLYKIEDRSLVKPLTSLQLNFLRRFPTHVFADEVQVLYAHLMSTVSPKSGIFAFRKLLALYPNSSYRPEALLAIGDLKNNELREYEAALKEYQEIIREYPTHVLVKHAYSNSGQIFDQQMKKYPEAIEAYQHVVKQFPDDKEALKAMQQIARLQHDDTEQPREAVKTLRKLAKMFHGDDGIDALADAARIAERELKDPSLFISIQDQLIQDFPNSDAAAEALYDFAINAEDAGNQEKANELFRQFLKQFPDHKLASKAQRRFE